MARKNDLEFEPTSEDGVDVLANTSSELSNDTAVVPVPIEPFLDGCKVDVA
jgi:hypothetical protein